MSASATAATVPAHRIGTACFRAIDGRMCGLHIKNTNVFALSVAQEPLSVFIGSFRFARLATATNTAASHLPSIAEAFINAFDDGDMESVKLLYSENPLAQEEDDSSEQGSRPSTASHNTLIGGNAAQLKALRRKSSLLAHHSTPAEYDRDHGGDNPTDTEAHAAVPTVLVHFKCFGVEHSVTLTLQPCHGTNKDTFVWSLLMDMYRVVLKQNTKRGSSPKRIEEKGGHQQRAQSGRRQRPGTAGSSSHPHVGNAFRSREPILANGVEQHIRANKASAKANPAWKLTTQNPHLLVRENPPEWAADEGSPSKPLKGPSPKYSQCPPGAQPVAPHKTARSAGGGWRPPQRGQGRAGASDAGEWNLSLNASREELQKQLLVSQQRVAELEHALASRKKSPKRTVRHPPSNKPSSSEHQTSEGVEAAPPAEIAATEKLLAVSVGSSDSGQHHTRAAMSQHLAAHSRPLPQLYLSGDVLEMPMTPPQFNR